MIKFIKQKNITFFLFCLLLCQTGFSQKRETDIQSTLTSYLAGLANREKTVNLDLFAVLVKTNRNKKITKTRIYFLKEDSVSYLDNNNLLSGFNATNLAEFTEDRCKTKNQGHQLTIVIPFVLKQVKEVLKPNQEPVLTAPDFENMIHLLKHVQKPKTQLGKPIVVFKEESYN